MKRLSIIVSFLFASILQLSAQHDASITQQEHEQKIKLACSGFVNAVAIVDSRQVVEAREGFLLLYPKKFQADEEGYDINDRWNFNQYAMTTRLNLKITGLDVGKAKAFAVIEGDFTGASNAENNSMRLRHAYIKLTWPKMSLLAGQYWHPLNIPEMIPTVLSLNTGAPYHPFSRQPQVRFDLKEGSFNLVMAATAQRDYFNHGPLGQSSTYLRNSVIPNLHTQVQFVKGDWFSGIAFDYKRLTPRLVTEKNLKTDEHLDTYAFSGFLKVNLKPLQVKGQVIYGQALNDHLMLGGYGVSAIDTATDRRKYSALSYLSAWLGVNTNGTKIQYGVYTGFCKGYGSRVMLTGPVYARDPEISYSYRISPMVTWLFGNFLVMSELEFTVASYQSGDLYYRYSDVVSGDVQQNFRLSLLAQYKF